MKYHGILIDMYRGMNKDNISKSLTYGAHLSVAKKKFFVKSDLAE